MLFAQNGNRVQPIQDSEAQKFLSLGYNITDAQGNVIKEAVPHDIPALKLAFNRHTTKIEQLQSDLLSALARANAAEQRIAELTSELAEVQSREVPSNAQVEKPKRTRTKKNTTQE